MCKLIDLDNLKIEILLMRVNLDYEVRVYIKLADHVSSYPHVTVIVH